MLNLPSITSPQGFTLRAFGCTLALSAASPAAQRALDRWIFPAFSREAWEPAAIQLQLVDTQEGFTISIDGAAAGSAVSEDELPLQLIRALDEAIIPRLTTLRAVHAGAICWQGRALLLPGRTHAGKSSLVSELLRRGARYLSDEYALIDPQGKVHAYPRPLLVRSGSPEQRPMLPDSFGAQVEMHPLPVAWILALEYHPDSPWQIRPLSQSEALMMLLRNTPHVLAEKPDILPSFGHAVAHAACFAGRRCDAAEAADEILRLMDASSGAA